MRIKKKSHIECPTEAQEAKKLMQWANHHVICKDDLIAIPNGGYRNLHEAMELKRQGVKSGVSDYFLAHPIYPNNIPVYSIRYFGLWLELKRISKSISRPTEKQLNWLSRMNKKGYATVIAYGADHAIEIIETYLSGKLCEYGINYEMQRM